MRIFISFFIFVWALAAHASYNRDCMKLLQPPLSRPVQQFQQRMQNYVHGQSFFQGLDPNRMEPIDYEAIFDLLHGLPMFVVFGDGSTLELRLDDGSVIRLRDKLATLNVLQVIYRPLALEKIRHILRNSCFAMNYENCDSYTDYAGLMDNRVRPFSRRQEQLLKWATLYQLPHNATARHVRETSLDESEIKAQISTIRNRRLSTSMSLLKDGFNTVDAKNGFAFFVGSFINDAFDRLENMTHENVAIFKKKL
jgi:hypothetical protein